MFFVLITWIFYLKLLLCTWLCVWTHRFVVSQNGHYLVRTFSGARSKRITMKLLMKKERKERGKILLVPISLRYGGYRCSNSNMENLPFSMSGFLCPWGQFCVQAGFLHIMAKVGIRHSKLTLSLVLVIFQRERVFPSIYVKSQKDSDSSFFPHVLPD